MNSRFISLHKIETTCNIRYQLQCIRFLILLVFFKSQQVSLQIYLYIEKYDDYNTQFIVKVLILYVNTSVLQSHRINTIQTKIIFIFFSMFLLYSLSFLSVTIVSFPLFTLSILFIFRLNRIISFFFFDCVVQALVRVKW